MNYRNASIRVLLNKENNVVRYLIFKHILMIHMSNICKIVLMWMPLFLIDDSLALPILTNSKISHGITRGQWVNTFYIIWVEHSDNTSMALCKSVVSPVLMHWRYHSLVTKPININLLLNTVSYTLNIVSVPEEAKISEKISCISQKIYWLGLTHCGLMTPYGIIELGQQWFR